MVTHINVISINEYNIMHGSGECALHACVGQSKIVPSLVEQMGSLTLLDYFRVTTIIIITRLLIPE